MKRIICELCSVEISASNYNKHLKRHKNHPETFKENAYRVDHDDLFCKFCKKECKNKNSLTQHEIRCKENPCRINVFVDKFNNKGKTPWNKGLSCKTDSRIQASRDTYNKNKENGKYHYRRKHTEEEKQKLREKALENGFGGFAWRKGVYYNDIKLDSSYEVAVAKSLDDNNIKWERPSRFKYHWDGKLHYYTPDFYLPEYDVYLDPKNDFLINNVNPRLGYKDTDKINKVSLENKIRIVILNKDQLCWDAIKNLIIPPPPK